MNRALLTLLLVLALPGGAAAYPDGGGADVIGGSDAQITDRPYQAALVDAAAPDDAGLRAFCGGVILDATHIVTAGHCVVADGKVVATPADVQVVVGTADLAAPVAAPRQRAAVADIRVHPGYEELHYTNDVAVLRLAEPLELGAAVAAIPIGTAATGDVATVSGFGVTVEGDFNTLSPVLRSADVDVLDENANTACTGVNGYDPARMICAARVGQDSCQGDSGGPLTVDHGAGDELVGIVSFGEHCANYDPPDHNDAGIYTELDAMSAFLSDLGPLTDPSMPPSLTGEPVVGQTLTCNPGLWPDVPHHFQYWFYAGIAAPSQAQAYSDSNTYALTTADMNRTIGCVVHDLTTGGIAKANTLGPITSAPVAGPPADATTPTPVAPVDTTRPESRVTRRTCTRTSCKVEVRVEDQGFTQGVRTVELRYTTKYRAACIKRHRRTTCARTRSGKGRAVKVGAGVFSVKLTALPAGSTTTVKIIAVDNAGNRQRVATKATLRTAKAKKKKR